MENVTLAVAKSYAEELLMGQGAIQGADGFSPIIVENASNTDEVYKLDITTKDGTFTTTNLIGKQGIQGIQGIQGEQGETGLQGQQGIQGIKGDKGDDGYPFLIYKQYEVGIEEFNEADYPEIGLMFMVHVWEEDKGYPVYRYTADGTDTPYSLVTHMNTEGIKGEKGDKGDTGEQGIAGLDGKDGKDGATYTPSIGEVTTVDDTELASVSVSIKEETKEALFNFAIPKGENGNDGKDAEQRVYITLSELGLDTTATINDIIGAMVDGSVFMYKTDVFDYATEYNNIQYGTVTIHKQSGHRVQVLMTDKDTGNLYVGRMNNTNKIVKWAKMITDMSDPYACTSYTALTGTEDLFTLPCGHYASDKINTTYNYPITDSSNVLAHIYVLGHLNDPANNKGYRIILYFDNKGRMYRINEWWGSFSNGWQEIITKDYVDSKIADLQAQINALN